MDVVVWLRSLGLEEYEAAFRDNKINERVLPSLTAEDLKELKVDLTHDQRLQLEHALCQIVNGDVWDE